MSIPITEKSSLGNSAEIPRTRHILGPKSSRCGKFCPGISLLGRDLTNWLEDLKRVMAAKATQELRGRSILGGFLTVEDLCSSSSTPLTNKLGLDINLACRNHRFQCHIIWFSNMGCRVRRPSLSVLCQRISIVFEGGRSPALFRVRLVIWVVAQSTASRLSAPG